MELIAREKFATKERNSVAKKIRGYDKFEEILVPDDDLHRAIPAEELKKRLHQIINNIYEDK